jgi:hypothetical protein
MELIQGLCLLHKPGRGGGGGSGNRVGPEGGFWGGGGTCEENRTLERYQKGNCQLLFKDREGRSQL